ncbi:tRNA (N6-isopentenyl adenosine(37)-C2)-methylthiotransferase MiaB [Patescibacteria group bacterium]|nr:tRNA (N6-isopentenyl adenosine(37)-C2)-methylthiotransferase MiaB [Patescibacteria group bacterium]
MKKFVQTYNIVTYGCAMNRSDSERITTVLEKAGYKKARHNRPPDLLVFNACSVRQSAVDRIYGQMGKFTSLRKRNPKFRAAVTGCILPKDRKKLLRGFDFIFNIRDLNKLAVILKGQTSHKKLINYFKIKPKYQNKFSCLVPISFGCNRFCTYCAVPYTRGLEINRSAADVLAEVAQLVSLGCKEITLLGQTVSSWQDPKNKEYVFVDLLRNLEKLPGKFWIRFHSPYILDFDDQLIDFLAKAEKTNNYFNLPLQSGNDQILKKMNRKYSVGQYLKVLSKLKSRVPGFNFSTDIIVGFCGETERQFQDSFKVFKKISPSMVYIAKYSVRPGTVAAKTLKDSVPLKAKKQRHIKLTKLLRQTAKTNLQKEVGKTLEVLVDNYLPEKKECLAKTRNFKTVRFKGSKKLLGKFARVKIIKAREFELEGELKELF